MNYLFNKYFLISLFLISSVNLAQNNLVQNKIRLAQNFEVRGQLEEAEQIYLELRKDYQNNYQIYHALFNTQLKLKKYEDAKSLAEEQIEISKSKVNLFGDLGSVYFLMGDESKASQIWTEALDLEPNNPFAYRTIANYLIEHRDLERAIEVLIKGNEVSDDKTLFSYDVANLYSITMDFEEATLEYCRILLKKPKQLNLVKNKIFSYLNANLAADPTINAVESLYEEEERNVLLELLIELNSRLGRDAAALKSTIELEQKTSNNGSVIFGFAQKAKRLQKYQIAAEAYNHIVNFYPKSALFAQAEIGYTKSLEAELDNRASSLNNWKPIIFDENINRGEYQKLIIAYKKLVGKYPQNKIGWEAEFRIGKIYLDNLKNLNKADSIFNKILDEMKSLQYIGEVNLGLSQIAIQNNDLEKAETHLQKVINSKMMKDDLKSEANFYLAKIKMWEGKFSDSIKLFKENNNNSNKENVNDALHYLLLLNTFKNDSTNLFSYVNSDYLVERNKIDSAVQSFKSLAENENIFLLNNFASLRYAELLIALNNYQEASIFLEEISNCDEDNIYLDRFLFLLGSNYYYGLNNSNKAMEPLNRIFNEFPNSIYFNKSRKIIAEINAGVGNTL